MTKIEKIRQAVADYIGSEGGCLSCCDFEEHKEDEKKLAELLNVPSYSDGSGYNFSKFSSEGE